MNHSSAFSSDEILHHLLLVRSNYTEMILFDPPSKKNLTLNVNINEYLHFNLNKLHLFSTVTPSMMSLTVSAAVPLDSFLLDVLSP